MKLKKLIFLLKINLKSSKNKSILYTLILALFFLIATIVSSAEFSIKKFDDKYINSDFGYKLLAVNVMEEDKRQEIIDNIEDLKIPEITKIFKSNIELLTGADIHESTLGIDGIIDIYGVYNGINYEVDYGRKIQNQYEIVCPSTFSPIVRNDFSNNSFFKIKNIIDGDVELYYNQTIVKDGKAEIYKEYNEKVKLVGTYDIKEQLTSYHTCYVSTALFEKIVKNSETIYENEEQKNNQHRDLSILLLVDNYNNMNKVQKKLLENGIASSPYWELENDLVEFMQKIVKYVTTIVMIISAICIYKFIKNIFIENKQNIALYKLFGYNNKLIGELFIIQYILLTICSIVISTLLAFLVKYLVTYIFTFYQMFSVMDIYIFMDNTIILFIGSIFLIIIIMLLFFIGSRKNSVLSLLNK